MKLLSLEEVLYIKSNDSHLFADTMEIPFPSMKVSYLHLHKILSVKEVSKLRLECGSECKSLQKQQE